MKHAKVKETTKKKSKGFRIFLLAWIVVLLGFGVYAVFYVNGTLKELQSNHVPQIITDRIAAMDDSEIDNLFSYNKDLESGDFAGRVREWFKSGAFTLKQVPNSDTYNIYNGDRQVLSAEIHKEKAVNKLGIFNYGIMDFKGFTPTEEKELFHVEITVPNDYSVHVGGKQIRADKITYAEGFKDGGNYVELPGESVYVLNNLTQWPDLRITDGGKDVAFDMSSKISLGLDYEQCASLEAAGCGFDAVDFMQKWMKFMQNDLAGGRRGFNTLEPNFIKDSEQYNFAYAWATNVDITFVSDHVIMNPAFTDESVSNVTKYDDDAISFDGHIKYHIRVKGKEKPQTFNSTVYLVKYEDTWRVVNIRSISK